MAQSSRIDQRVQDMLNLQRPIQDFLGWVLGLDKNHFMAVLEKDGHHDSDYQEEKWEEFERNKLAFVWKWTSAFVSYWSSLK